MRGWLRGLLLAGLLVAAAVAATYVRYGSLDPCRWTVQDMTASSGMPELLIEARIRAQFVLEGVLEPGFSDCLHGWWAFRLDDLPEQQE